MKINNYSLFFILNFVLVSFGLAQKIQSTQLNFEATDYKLSDAQKKHLDSVIAKLPNTAQAFKLEITGHSDSIGSKPFNQSLSEKRAKETALYFESKGFSKKKITAIGKGSAEPLTLNETEKERALNRRAEIIFSLDLPSMENVLGIKDKGHVNKFKAESGQVIQYSSGTQILIPPSAFVDKDGKEVSGEIEFRYKEYRDPVDFLLSDIPMNFMSGGNSYHFNSAGMFKMLAYKKGAPLYLKKGENLEMKFALTKKLPDLNFYKLDTVSKQWSELAKLTDQNAQDLLWMPSNGYSSGGFGHGSGSGMLCELTNCMALDYLRLEGMKYANLPQNSYSWIQWFASVDKLRLTEQLKKNGQEIAINKSSISSAVKKTDEDRHTYKLKKLKQGRSKIIFTLKCEAQRNNEISAFKDAEWKYDTKNNPDLSGSIFSKQWDSCGISTSGEYYTMVLKNSGKEVTLKNLKLLMKDKVKRKDKPFYLHSINKNYETLLERRIKNIEIIDGLTIKQQRLIAEFDSLNKLFVHSDSILKPQSRDSIYCFFNKSRKYMTSDEKTMDFEKWTNEFVSHKPQMLERYSGLNAGAEFTECRKQALRMEELMKIAAEKQKQQASFETNVQQNASSILTNMKISNLGIFNCDQIRSLENRLEVLADYKDEKNHRIDPILIYIVDSEINGLIRYDGYSGYSPYDFIYNKASLNTMIAIDSDWSVYTCYSDKFQKINTLSKPVRNTFILKKIEKPKKREDIKKFL